MNSSGRQIGVGVGMGPSRKDVNNFAVSSERPYLCQECGKAYKMRSHLSQHIRYHTGEKPFKCDICGQNFHLSGDRNRHVIKMHSDYRPHKCLYCPKVTATVKNNFYLYKLTSHVVFWEGRQVITGDNSQQATIRNKRQIVTSDNRNKASANRIRLLRCAYIRHERNTARESVSVHRLMYCYELSLVTNCRLTCFFANIHVYGCLENLFKFSCLFSVVSLIVKHHRKMG